MSLNKDLRKLGASKQLIDYCNWLLVTDTQLGNANLITVLRFLNDENERKSRELLNRKIKPEDLII